MTRQPDLMVTAATMVVMALPGWVPEIETKPAPMPLLVVQSFVNTWEGDSGNDLLEDLSTATRWLGEAGLVHGAPRRDLEQARALREAIRALLVRNAHGEVPDDAERRAVSDLAQSPGTVSPLAPTEASSWNPSPARRPCPRPFSFSFAMRSTTGHGAG